VPQIGRWRCFARRSADVEARATEWPRQLSPHFDTKLTAVNLQLPDLGPQASIEEAVADGLDGYRYALSQGT